MYKSVISRCEVTCNDVTSDLLYHGKSENLGWVPEFWNDSEKYVHGMPGMSTYLSVDQHMPINYWKKISHCYK